MSHKNVSMYIRALPSSNFANCKYYTRVGLCTYIDNNRKLQFLCIYSKAFYSSHLINISICSQHRIKTNITVFRSVGWSIYTLNKACRCYIRHGKTWSAFCYHSLFVVLSLFSLCSTFLFKFLVSNFSVFPILLRYY